VLQTALISEYSKDFRLRKTRTPCDEFHIELKQAEEKKCRRMNEEMKKELMEVWKKVRETKRN
jgi:hypothetical protein